jgi:hypothetical protein
MTEDEEKPFTLSREDLYELVWSKPMRELAKDFGISDVALAKRCHRSGCRPCRDLQPTSLTSTYTASYEPLVCSVP